MAEVVKFERDMQRFDCLGLDLNRPVDSVKPGKFPYLKNCRSFLAGRIEPRDGITDQGEVVAGQTPVHSCRRLNDPNNSTWARIVGAGTHLAYGQNPYTDLDSGYSGDPLALVPYRPDLSPQSWMYVADRSRMRKATAQGNLHTIGLAPPTNAPTAVIATPSYKVVDDFQATAGWAQGGTAGAPTLLSAGPGYRVNTTITQILYDVGTTGWASINPASMVGIGPGARLEFNPGGGTDETAAVQTIAPGKAGTTTTIASIVYDVGTTGLCSIALATPVNLVGVDSLLRDSTVGENVRVLSVNSGPQGISSLRVLTVGTFAATDNIQILPSFRIYLANNHAAAETVRIDGVRTAVTTGIATLTKTSALDLSLFAAQLPVLPSDYMHISLRVSDPTVITALKIQLDVDATLNNFTANFYWREFRTSDITPSLSNLQSLVDTRAQIIQRILIDQPTNLGSPGALLEENLLLQGKPITNLPINPRAPNPPVTQLPTSFQELSSLNDAISQQLTSGASQWVELVFHISELIRVGSDFSRTLQNVAALQIVAITTGAVNIDMDAWWIEGGYGPDVDPSDSTTIPYVYRYRARVPATGATSNWSPAMRGGFSPLRQQVTVKPTQYAAPSGTTFLTTDLVLDVQRFGGRIADWHYVGTTPNVASPSFADTYPDDIVVKLPSEGQIHWQPWPIIQTPISGTTGTVAGTTLNDSGATFNLLWAPGTEIKVNGIPYTLYRVISTARLETVEDMGSQTGVVWQIDEPTLLAQNLPCLWGDEQLGALFACGDPINPGRLYYTTGQSGFGDADSTSESSYLDVTSPSEPLMNGVVYNQRSYLFSSERMFQILATGDVNEPWVVQEIPNGKGLFARWAITRTPAPLISFLSKDGINATTGGAAIALTDADLYDLFPNEGNLGVAVNGVSAPNVISAQAANLRLDYYDEYLYFDYPIAGGGTASLVLAFDLGATMRGQAPGGWFWDVYTPNVVFHYGEEGAGVHSLLVGGSDSHIYQYTGNSDNGTAISMEISTPCRDQNDPRLNKLYGDIMLDANTFGVNVTATPFLNNNSTALAAVTINTAARAQTAIPLGTAWQTAKNIALNLVCLVSTSARPFFYIWEPRWTFEAAPISALAWEISPTTFGMLNFKHMGIVRIAHVSTVDLSLIITIDNVVQPTITIPNSGGVYTQTVFRVPVYKAKLWKLRIASTTEWRLDARDTSFQMKDWASDGAYEPLRVFGDFSMVEG